MVKLTQTRDPVKDSKHSPNLKKSPSVKRTTHTTISTRTTVVTKPSTSLRFRLNKSKDMRESSNISTTSKIAASKRTTSVVASISPNKSKRNLLRVKNSQNQESTPSKDSIEVESEEENDNEKEDDGDDNESGSIEGIDDDENDEIDEDQIEEDEMSEEISDSRGRQVSQKKISAQSSAIRPTRSSSRGSKVLPRKRGIIAKKSKKAQVQTVITNTRLRPRKETNYAWRTGDDFEDFGYDDDEGGRSGRRKTRKKLKIERDYLPKEKVRRTMSKEEFEDIYEDEKDSHKFEEVLDKIPKNKKQLMALHERVKQGLKQQKEQFILEQKELEEKVSLTPLNSIPISADVRDFDFLKLADAQKKVAGRLFDVIMMDPPWQLSTSTPSRGVAIGYNSLSDEFIKKIPIPKLSENGFICLWTINAKFVTAVNLIEHWGYKLVDEVAWIKRTVNGKIAKSHGFYLQHAKETCLIGVKGKDMTNFRLNQERDVIFSLRRGQSQKPDEMYQLIENLAPNGYYLEIFGRRNNLRDKWVTVGNEL